MAPMDLRAPRSKVMQLGGLTAEYPLNSLYLKVSPGFPMQADGQKTWLHLPYSGHSGEHATRILVLSFSPARAEYSQAGSSTLAP